MLKRIYFEFLINTLAATKQTSSKPPYYHTAMSQKTRDFLAKTNPDYFWHKKMFSNADVSLRNAY